MRIKLAVVLMLSTAAAWCAVAQEKGEVVFQSGGAVGVGIGEKVSRTPILGAPYTATVTNESLQTLADGNRITQSSSGTTARDSQGRTRQDAPLPAIGNMSAANAPHLVFINDPVGQKRYTLNLTEKTAQSFAMSRAGSGTGVGVGAGDGGSVEANTFFLKLKQDAEASASGQAPEIAAQKTLTIMDNMDKVKAESFGEAAQVDTEDLGTQTMEGVIVTGTRTTKTIPAGRIGNEKPISIVIEVWTSPELRTVVMSKRSDPRMGEQTFRLTNIVRAEPDASLFTVPTDFKAIDGQQTVIYRMKQ
jgi:hypothetical protein